LIQFKKGQHCSRINLTYHPNESFITLKARLRLKFQGLRSKLESENLCTPSPHDMPYNTTFTSINYMQLD